MNKAINPKKIQEIVDLLNNNKLDFALEKIKHLSIEFPNNQIINKLFANTYFKKMDWKNSIKYHEKILLNENDKYKIFTNIGFAYFKLGEIRKSIIAYKNSIKENSNFEIAYNNIAISYIEIGLYEKAFEIFLKLLEINRNNYSAQKNLIYLLNFINPENIGKHLILEINRKIKVLANNFNINNVNKIDSLKKILNESDKIIKSYNENLKFEETQIYRKNSTDLNCKRHFKIFNKFNIIPKFCFSCYKVQINLKNVVDLIKLYFIFDNINLENNNIRKCIVELRDNIKGNYKGYIYCKGLTEAKEIREKINDLIINAKFVNHKIEIKHGCTEYYKSFPKFENINMNGEQEMQYDKSWNTKEISVDKLEPLRSELDKKVWVESIKGINLSDILIIKNWIHYASFIGDNSYKEIYDNKIKDSFINNILRNQLNFRINNLN